MYTEHIDTVGHNAGPGGSKIRQAVEELDKELVHFFEELRRRKKLDKVMHLKCDIFNKNSSS